MADAPIVSSDEEDEPPIRPSLVPEDVPHILQELFGKECPVDNVTALDSYDDCNFRVDIPSEGSRYTLKVHNASDSTRAPFLEAQTAALAFLAARGFTVPESLPSTQHSSCTPLHLCAVVGAPERAPLAVRLMRWVSGRPLVEHPNEDCRSLESAGRYLAFLRRALDAFDHPGAHTDHPWDLRHFHTLRPQLSQIADTAHRELVSRAMDLFEEVVLPKEAAGVLPRAVIHCDFNDSNIIASETDPTLIVGVIDFGDMVHSWRVLDLVAAAADASGSRYGRSAPTNTCNSILCTMREACDAVLRGFGAAAPAYLTGPEADCFWVLCCCRLALAATITDSESAKDPTNEYLSMDVPVLWAALRCMLDADQSEFTSRLRVALQLPS